MLHYLHRYSQLAQMHDLIFLIRGWSIPLHTHTCSSHPSLKYP